MKQTLMAWEDLAEMMLSQLRNVGIEKKDIPNRLDLWIADSPLSLHAAADPICVKFAASKQWPIVEGDIRLLLFVRSVFATEAFFSRHLNATPHLKQKEAQRWIEHFLVSGWYHEWPRWTKERFSGGIALPFDPWKAL